MKKAEQNYEMMRFISNLSGVVFDQQIVAMKATVMLMTKQKVTITIFPVQMEIEITVHGGVKKEILAEIPTKCCIIVGHNWKITAKHESFWSKIKRYALTVINWFKARDSQ